MEFERGLPNTSSADVLVCPYVKGHLLYLDYLRDVYIVNSVLNAVFSLVAVFLNAVVLFSIKRTQTLHDPSHLLLAILACTDLGVGLIEQPMYVLYKAAELNKHAQISCMTGAITNMLAGLLAGMSFLIMTFISIDRFLALHLHLRYKSVVTRSLVLKVTFVSFVFFAIGVSFYPWLPRVTVYFGISCILVCLIVSTILYCKIYKIFRRHQLSVEASKSGRRRKETIALKKYWKSVISFAFVHLLMVVFYLPYAIVLITRTVTGITKEYKLALNVTATVIYINSSLNPLVYCWRIQDVRRAVTKTLNQLFVRQNETSNARTSPHATPNEPYLVPVHPTE